MSTSEPSDVDHVIDVKGLTKTFGRGAGATRALDGLDMSVSTKIGRASCRERV